MDGLDEVERLSLEQSIARIETVIASEAASYGSSMTSMLVRFVENAKQRIGSLDQQNQSVAEEKRKQQEQDLTIAHMVERETALNQAEREQYGVFLAKEFFTKSDFGELESFYTNTWDRLTEGGKAQMSHRVWEGVRRDEYKFSELPEVVKEKEAESLRELLARSKRAPSDLDNILERDRDEFISAWDAGKKRESYEILDRPVFAENVAKSAEAVPKMDEASRRKGDEGKIVQSESGRNDSKVTTPPQRGGKADVGLSTDFLVTLADADEKPTAIVASNKAEVPKVR